MCGMWLCPKNGEIDYGMHDHWLPRMRQFASGEWKTGGLGEIRERLRLHVQVFQDHRMLLEQKRCYCRSVTVQAFARQIRY
jgi:hypothetical protein